MIGLPFAAGAISFSWLVTTDHFGAAILILVVAVGVEFFGAYVQGLRANGQVS